MMTDRRALQMAIALFEEKARQYAPEAHAYERSPKAWPRWKNVYRRYRDAHDAAQAIRAMLGKEKIG